MDKQSIFFTGLIAIIAIAIMLLIIQFISKRHKINLGLEPRINQSYSIWISTIMISFVLFLKVALELIENSIETIIYSKTINNTFLAIMEKTSIFVGFTFFITFFSYYLITIIMRMFSGNRKLNIEIDNNNIGYFIINGLCIILFTYSILNIFEHFLRWFTPVVNTPFYH
jgi:hypothetical protein